MMDFCNLSPSTVTITVNVDTTFDLPRIANLLLRDHPETLGRKQIVTNKEYKQLYFSPGAVIYLKYKTDWYGVKKSSSLSSDASSSENDFFQITFVIYVSTLARVHVMLFRNGKLKVAGCKGENDVLFVIDRLKKYYSTLEYRVYNYVIANEMINITFGFPFVVDKLAINKLFQDKPNCLAHYEQTTRQYVTVKLYTTRPTRIKALVKYSRANATTTLSVREDPLTGKKKKPNTCFMVFPRRVVMSGCGIDYSIMEEHYNIFMDLVRKNEHNIALPVKNELPDTSAGRVCQSSSGEPGTFKVRGKRGK